MRKIKQAVLQTLRENRAAREDDRLLFFAVCRHFGLILLPDQEALITDVPFPATVARTRARIQNVEGRLLGGRQKGRKETS